MKPSHHVNRIGIIVVLLFVCGMLWLPIVHGITTSRVAETYSYGVAGYYSVTHPADGNTTHRLEPDGILISIAASVAFAAMSARWWWITKL